MDRRLADLLEALRASRKQVRVQDGRLYIGPPPVEPALLALVRQHRDELVAYLTAERHDVVERARSLLQAGAIPTRPLATALGRVENPQRVVRALVAVSRYRLSPESRAAVERELAAILAALRDGPEQPPTPDRTTEHPGNGHGDIARTLPGRRCSCGGMLEPSDHPGWLRCSRCRNYVRSDDPALGREKGVTR